MHLFWSIAGYNILKVLLYVFIYVASYVNLTRIFHGVTSLYCCIVVFSSGSGRTGTFILVDRMLQLVDVDGKLDLFRTTLEMRNNRIFMVQTEVVLWFKF